MGEEGLDSAGLLKGINYLLLLLCVCWGACELAGRGAVSQKEEEAARSTYPALCFLRRHISTPKLIRGSGVTLECTPEPPSGRKMPGRNHWSQVPLTGGENPKGGGSFTGEITPRTPKHPPKNWFSVRVGEVEIPQGGSGKRRNGNSPL